MSDRPGKKLFPNPFYVILLIASTLFVVNALAWLVIPSVLDQAPRAKGGAVEFLRGFDRNTPLALGVEFLVMLAAGTLAMLTDRWFPERPGSSS